MKTPKHHYSRYLISVQFDKNMEIDTLSEQIANCLNFLSELGKLALTRGRKLHASYSIVNGMNGKHAHFGVSFMPQRIQNASTFENFGILIDRKIVIELLNRNNFYVDNPKQAIKKITHSKKFVTNYIIYQPKEHQKTIFSDFYIHDNYIPSHSKQKPQSYCSSAQFSALSKSSKNNKKIENNHEALAIMIISIMISILAQFIAQLF